MAEPEVLLSGHYQALRAETLERIRLRDQYVVWLATVFSIALGVYTSANQWWGFLLGIPLLSAISGLLYAHTDLTLNALGRWYRNIYGSAVEEYRTVNQIQHQIPFWDHSIEYTKYTKSVTFYLRYFATALLILGIGLVATALCVPHIKSATPDMLIIGTIGLVVISTIGAAGPLAAWWVRYNGR